jgi:PAS domain S-box-containing protein
MALDYVTRAAVEWDENQRAVRIVGTHIDITERKRTEEQLQLNQELLRSNNVRYKELARELEILIANAPVGIMFVSNGVIIRANEALADLCRFPDAKSMIGVKTTFLYHNDEDYRAFGQAVIPRLEADELVELEWYLRRANGESFMARVAGRALPAETYEKGAVWMIEDITGQRKTLDALRESESRLQRIMNSSLIGILYGSDGSRLTDVNRMFCQLSGYSREQSAGRAVSVASRVVRAGSVSGTSGIYRNAQHRYHGAVRSHAATCRWFGNTGAGGSGLSGKFAARVGRLCHGHQRAPAYQSAQNGIRVDGQPRTAHAADLNTRLTRFAGIRRRRHLT